MSRDVSKEMSAIETAERRTPIQWRSLEQLAGSDEFLESLEREFPRMATEFADLDPDSRRQFLKVMGASLALAGVAGCAVQPAEEIVPYVRAPERMVPGKPKFYATAVPLGGYGVGVLAETHMGRPTKLEGNDAHPSSLGAADAWTQAAILGLYDPDRSQVVTFNGRIKTYGDFVTAWLERLGSIQAAKGAGFRILTGAVTSPTMAAQLEALTKRLPEMKRHQHEPIGRSSSRQAAVEAFGEDVDAVHDLSKADVIVALDSDLLGIGPARMALARQFAERREIGVDPAAADKINRLYVVEPTPTITGSMADHRLALASGGVARIAVALARGVGVKLPSGGDPIDAESTRFAAAVVKDLLAHRGSSLVVAGVSQPPSVHVLAHAINAALENVGKTVSYVAPIEAHGGESVESLRELVEDARAGKVETLVIIGPNPVYDACADVDFAAALRKIPLSIRLGEHDDETAALCRWNIPQAHALESWGDVRAHDGTASIQQPLIAPLYAGKSAIEFLALITGDPGRNGVDLLREHWKDKLGGGDFEKAWRKALHEGVVAGSAAAKREVTLRPIEKIPDVSVDSKTVELAFRADASVYDGRFANNGWLQELPRPMNKLTWGNALLVSPALAASSSLSDGDEVEVTYHGRSLDVPIMIQPGQADGVVTLHLGFGRTRVGRVGAGVGESAYRLRTSDAPWSGVGVTLRKTNRRRQLATTQQHQTMAGRALVRHAPIGEFRARPDFAHEPDHHIRDISIHSDKPLEPASSGEKTHALPPPFVHPKSDGNSWAMVINLNTCIGCGSCTLACQAENNIPVVGADQASRGREMHWIRVDRYFETSDPERVAENPRIHHQPVPCMHCENAPCELVCPVGATMHDAEGLNVMVYNRCVGTRYCGNNCPFKVRRFNFYQFSDQKTPALKLLNNPDVTVRTRGVMEKCTYCVQRISAARIAAETESPPRTELRDGEVVTACQAACPTRAITFGNIQDPKSKVLELRESARSYALLAELNVRPRTTYLAKLTNPNPELAPEAQNG